MKKMLSLACALIGMHLLASAANGDDIAYPTVAAALEALKARQDVAISIHDGWTIIEDKASKAVWSFTAPGHPAHPAVVKRTPVQQGGDLVLSTRAKCGASKQACDTLMAQFAQMTEQLRGRIAADAGSTTAPWAPSPLQIKRLQQTTNAYFAARDSRDYAAAYALLADSQKQGLPYATWLKQAQEFNALAGAPLDRKLVKISWYQNPPGVPPGIYAAADFSAQYENLGLNCGFLAWREQEDGHFLMVREETNYIERKVQSKMNGEQLASAFKQFGCKE